MFLVEVGLYWHTSVCCKSSSEIHSGVCILMVVLQYQKEVVSYGYSKERDGNLVYLYLLK